MLIRISLILAIVAALAAGALNIFQVRDKINTLISQRDDYHTQLTQTQGTLSRTQGELARTKSTLSQTQQELSDANSQRDAAQQAEAAATKRANDLSDKLTKTASDLATTQDQLAAYTATGKSAEEVGKLSGMLSADQQALDVAKEENKVLLTVNSRLTNELNQFMGLSPDILLPANLEGKVLVVDPKWDFVVLNVGDDQGVIQNGQLLVSRDGKLVAKVIVRFVDKDQCIANIIPGWKLGPVIEGDEVTPAYPAPTS
ncbi:MAG TPA: hypothetical protein VMD27_07500 [Candidatus Aquilonibacter sp.]|nr:hypothetical protein [Candidatus Aquilonibacter sp.]